MQPLTSGSMSISEHIIQPPFPDNELVYNGLLRGNLGPRHSQTRTFTLAVVALCIGLLSIILATAALIQNATSENWSPAASLVPSPSPSPSTSYQPPPSASTVAASWVPTNRIAFGSCTAYDTRSQPVWDAVVASEPDAWLWVGDMAYLDTPNINCEQLPDRPECQCESDFMRHPPHQCSAGNVDHARDRSMHQVNVPEYVDFLRYMCPSGMSQGGVTGGLIPPTGSDPESCPRPIFGIWDDHDFGWNNGNRRMPNKHTYKTLYLDAIGENPQSPRRSFSRGIQWNYTLNAGSDGKEIDLLLLDERWYRDTLPCERRRDWCISLLATGNSNESGYAWCEDFLISDGVTGTGSCCSKDEKLAAWCAQPTSSSHSLWYAACDPTSKEFGTVPLAMDRANTTLQARQEWMWDNEEEYWPWLIDDSPFCDMIGMQQRKWLAQHLASSTSPLTIIASGSVVVGSVGFVDPGQGTCSADDWECYKNSQVHLLHTLANVTSGCVLVLTGDYHYGDLKVIMPGSDQPYATNLQSQKLAKPVYQLTSSGLTNSTAKHQDRDCVGSFVEDLLGLRPLGKCSYTSKPNFGMVEVDWERGVVRLQLRDEVKGDISVGDDGKGQKLSFYLDTCMPV